MFSTQWHLGASGSRNAINVTRVWDDYTGHGISVGVYDDGVDYRHAEFAANYDASKQITDGLPANWTSSGDTHGTAVAGIIAAANNGVGTVGVAYGASLTSVPVIRSLNPASMVTAFDAMDRFDVVNNSWGFSGAPFTVNFAGPANSYYAMLGSEVAETARTGRGGLGTIIVKSAGNSRTSGVDTNHDNLTNDRHIVVAAATDANGKITSFSTPGASVLVSAPGYGLATTDLSGTSGTTSTDYRSSFSGTSAAAPVVSGVAALILDANPDLGWRDVQEILAYSSHHTGTSIGTAPSGYERSAWSYNGASTWNGGGLHFSNDYGFGLIDALSAVRLAETWTATATSANELSATVRAVPGAAIPDANSAGTSIVLVQGSAIVIDHVELRLDVAHLNRGDLVVQLTSPSGTVSTLVNRSLNGSDSGDNLVFTLQSNAFWGESSAGSWTVTVKDLKSGTAGIVRSVELTVYGDAASADDTYVYTNEFASAAGAHRSVLGDEGGGADTLNAAAVSTASTIDLRAGATSLIAGRALVITSTTVIEHAHGGDGGDVLTGNAASNQLFGHRGDDSLAGGDGDDVLDGGSGEDIAVFSGIRANYSITADGTGGYFVIDAVGADGSDHITNIELLKFADGIVTPVVPVPMIRSGSSSADILTGGILDDTLEGFAGDDRIEAMSGNDRLDGGAGNDRLMGGRGDDRLIGGAGADQLDGGDDFDVAEFLTSAVAVRVNLASGTGLSGDAQGDSFIGIEGVIGSTFSDVLTGNALVNSLYGLGGNDTLDGGAGADTLVGGAGNDTYYADDLGDTLIELSTEGVDKVFASISWTLSAAFENLTLSGAAAINATGNDFDNVLTGNAAANRLVGLAGNDVLNGGAGADTLVGGTGNDIYYVDNAGDLVVEVANGGIDSVRSTLASYTLGNDIEKLYLDGTAGIEGIGNALANSLYGNSAANRLAGGDGNDLIDGGAGSDTLNGDSGNDSLYGKAGDDQLSGGAGDDLLAGISGADLLTGGAGRDRFDFDALSDSTAAARDVIFDFVAGEDRIDLYTIDAKSSAAGNNAFLFIGQADFSGAGGEVRQQFDSVTGGLLVQGDVNGDAVADFEILLSGQRDLLQATDFVL